MHTHKCFQPSVSFWFKPMKLFRCLAAPVRNICYQLFTFFLSETLFLSFNHHLLRFLFVVLACVDFSILVLSLSLLLYVPFHSPSPLLCVCRCSFCSRSLACLSECECWLLACLSVWLTAPALRRNAWFCQCLSARPYLQNLILTASTVSVASLPPSRFPSSYFILPFPPFSINVLPSSVFRDWHCISSCLFKILQKCLICDCDVNIMGIIWSSLIFKMWWWLNSGIWRWEVGGSIVCM